VIGGIVSGTLLGAALDLLWRFFSPNEKRRKTPGISRDSHSTSEPRTPE
jgi:hypothetical protein